MALTTPQPAAPVSLPLLLSLDDVAQALGCSRSHVKRAIAEGQLESCRLGRLRRVTHAQLERFIANLEAQGRHVA